MAGACASGLACRFNTPKYKPANARTDSAAMLAMSSAFFFAVLPGVVVETLFGSNFREAIPYVFEVGLIGLVLSIDNLLIQFFMAMHDRLFVPMLAAGCIGESVLIVCFHATIGQVLTDVLGSLVALLVLLSVRAYSLASTFKPWVAR